LLYKIDHAKIELSELITLREAISAKKSEILVLRRKLKTTVRRTQ
jgi:hypothetical protein